MDLDQRYSMSQYASKQDREDAINRAIDRLVKKRDWAADVKGSPLLAWSYQQDIDRLAELLTPAVSQAAAAPNEHADRIGEE